MMAVRCCRRYRPHIRTLMFLSIIFTVTLLVITFMSSSDSEIIEDQELILGDSPAINLAEWKRNHPRPQRKKNGGNKLIFEDEDDDDPIQICKVPRLTLEADANKFAYHKMPRLNCSGNNLMYFKDSKLRINHTVLNGRTLSKCEYSGIEWMSDSMYTYTDTLTRKEPPFEISVQHDFVRVECYLKKEGDEEAAEELPDKDEDSDQDGVTQQYEMEDDLRFYHYYDQGLQDFDQFLVQAVRKEDVVERAKSIKPSSQSSGLNVLIIALDSMSHLCYQRKLPKTYRYIQEQLNAVILQGYNIVGDATTAAIVPLFTGKHMAELPEVRRNWAGSTYVDSYPLLWNKFEQQGYVTLYAEDQPTLGTFNLRMNGFEQIPVDHYMRPFWLAAGESSLKYESEDYCVGATPHHKFQLDYVKSFFKAYPDIPKFAFHFMGELSHHNNNPVEYADADIVQSLEELRVGGHLDDTLVIVMGDHGARYSEVRKTIQGKLEERLPMMSLAFPKSFQQKHPKLMSNLRTNAHRLATPFDMHETLRDILNVDRPSAGLKYTSRSMSLLKPMPINRTCDSAGVDLHWCTCLHWETLPQNDKNVLKAVPLVIDYINKKTEPIRELCQKLTLKEVNDVKVITPNEKLLRFTKSIDGDQRIANFSTDIHLDIIHFQIIFKTSPNDGLYEATVHLDVKSKSFTVHPDISRINLYGDQPHCVVETHADLRKFCLCKEPYKPTAKSQPKRRKKAEHKKTEQ